jgi:hypothetical protein
VIPPSRCPGEQDTAATPAAVRRLVLVLDPDPDRLHAAARAVRTAGARVRVLDSVAGDSVAGDAASPVEHPRDDAEHPCDDADPDVILVRADPGSWTAAAAFAAHHPRLGRPVDAFLVSEGPLERFSTLITDFPGLRLLLPGAEVGSLVAGLV